MIRWMHGYKRSFPEPEIHSSVVFGLQDLYRRNLLPFERDYKFPHFYSPLLTDADFAAKPMVLLLGQYSTGKTSFIQHLLERDYPGQRIGPEPTTDQFVAVMYGENDQVIPGNAAVVDKSRPWGQLADFGNSFLVRFQCALVKSPVLKGLTLIDTPGVLSGNKQCDRGYDFESVMKWFAERVDLILLIFDAHKLDISDEFRRCIAALRGNDSKIRILLNKADLVNPQQLMRVYGALMWSLGKVIPTPEVTRVYIGSFWDMALRFPEYRKLFEAEASDLYSDIASLPRHAALRKLNDFIKRCRLAKVHALILSHMRKQLPLFGKASKQKEMTRSLETTVYPSVQRDHSVALGDFPSVELLQQRLPQIELSRIPKLDIRRLQCLDEMLSRSIPSLMKLIPQEESRAMLPSGSEMLMGGTSASPFLTLSNDGSRQGLPAWVVKKYLETVPDIDRYRDDFVRIGPNAAGFVTGQQVKANLIAISGFPSTVLHRIWHLADVGRDGSLDLFEYAIARHFIEMKSEGFELPYELPGAIRSAIPPGVRCPASAAKNPCLLESSPAPGVYGLGSEGRRKSSFALSSVFKSAAEHARPKRMGSSNSTSSSRISAESGGHWPMQSHASDSVTAAPTFSVRCYSNPSEFTHGSAVQPTPVARMCSDSSRDVGIEPTGPSNLPLSMAPFGGSVPPPGDCTPCYEGSVLDRPLPMCYARSSLDEGEDISGHDEVIEAESSPLEEQFQGGSQNPHGGISSSMLSTGNDFVLPLPSLSGPFREEGTDIDITTVRPAY